MLKELAYSFPKQYYRERSEKQSDGDFTCFGPGAFFQVHSDDGDKIEPNENRARLLPHDLYIESPRNDNQGKTMVNPINTNFSNSL
jgi:hypothetical protein